MSESEAVLDALMKNLAEKFDPVKRTERMLSTKQEDLEKMDEERFGEFLDEMLAVVEIIAEKIDLYERFSCKGLDRWKGYRNDSYEISHRVTRAAANSVEKKLILKSWLARNKN